MLTQIFKNNLPKRKTTPFFSAGFTLIETFVAITILLISILGPLSLVSKFYADNTYARNQIAASFLAQDALESVDNILRNNKLLFNQQNQSGCVATLPNGWLGSLANVCEPKGASNPLGCDIDSLTGEVDSTNASDKGYRLYKQASNGFYSTKTTGMSTPYYRRIVISNYPVDTSSPAKADLRAADVRVEINWEYKGKWQPPVVVKSRIIMHQCL